LTLYKFVSGDAGIIDVFGAQNPAQPYVGFSGDLKQWIPASSVITDLNLNVGTRYNTDVGGSFSQHLGIVFSVGYQLP
jgi:hypothetical protein